MPHAEDPVCGVCRASLPDTEAWECRVCRRAVHADCCDGDTLERTPVGRLASTCRSCRGSNTTG